MDRRLLLLCGILTLAALEARAEQAAPAMPAAPEDAAETVPELPPVVLSPIVFGEDRHEPPGSHEGWRMGFHGYARMPLRFHGSFETARSPYLVDDNYYLSGFSTLRNQETEWAELFLSAEGPRTRFVVGLNASQFSDWSLTTLQGQGGIATAFVEHAFSLGEKLGALDVRAGMFWDRHGYVPSYDTYLLGRMHLAGLRLGLRLWDLWYLQATYGAHAEVINANQGFTPVACLRTGIDLGWLDLAFFMGSTWTRDSEREFSIIEDGTLRVFGGQGRLAIPHTGPLDAVLAFYKARNVIFLANSFEVLHSTGGRGLTQNFFGPDSQNGTGEILTGALELGWELDRTVGALAGPRIGRLLEGAEIRLFGMFAWVASEQSSENPLENFHQRVYLKWGIEPTYRPASEDWGFWFVALRFDRVILDTDHASMAFRVLTPRIGIVPLRDLDLEIFVSYSSYFYGDNVKLRPNQIPGDLSITTPDSSAFKIQAQVSW